mmetsp:Transcript_137165/g.324937  ORF Transcript_137165/g.324937 Transcript_137165/m.324937 type:complete len:226 (-) Transcript_137165:684-1361(-)
MGHALHVQATRRNVRGDQNISASFFQCLDGLAAERLRHAAMAGHHPLKLLLQVAVYLHHSVASPAKDDDRGLLELASFEDPSQRIQLASHTGVCPQACVVKSSLQKHLALDEITVIKLHSPFTANLELCDTAPAALCNHRISWLKLAKSTMRRTGVDEDMRDRRRHWISLATGAVDPSTLCSQKGFCQLSHREGDGCGPESRLSTTKFARHGTLSDDLLKLTPKS